MSEDRIDDLVDQMTLAEQVSLLSGEDFWSLPAIARLGIHKLRVTDGPNGNWIATASQDGNFNVSPFETDQLAAAACSVRLSRPPSASASSVRRRALSYHPVSGRGERSAPRRGQTSSRPRLRRTYSPGTSSSCECLIARRR